jgi:hypothetical protein
MTITEKFEVSVILVLGASVFFIASTLATEVAALHIGALLLGSKIDQSIAMTAWTWTVLVVIVLGVGFCIKDFVFEWNPWRIYREKDHMNIIFTWKK